MSIFRVEPRNIAKLSAIFAKRLHRTCLTWNVYSVMRIIPYRIGWKNEMPFSRISRPTPNAPPSLNPKKNLPACLLFDCFAEFLSFLKCAYY